MFGGKAFGGGGTEDEAEEVFLNLTPMIDILTCLLFFLLLSFGAVLIALVNASVPVIADGDPNPTVSKMKITMGLQISDKGMLATASHDQMPEEELAKLKRFFPKKKNEHDFKGLHEYLWKIKKQVSQLELDHHHARARHHLRGHHRGHGRLARPAGRHLAASRSSVPMFPEAVISTIVE